MINGSAKNHSAKPEMPISFSQFLTVLRLDVKAGNQGPKRRSQLCNISLKGWLWGKDLSLLPLGYESDELRHQSARHELPLLQFGQ